VLTCIQLDKPRNIAERVWSGKRPSADLFVAAISFLAVNSSLPVQMLVCSLPTIYTRYVHKMYEVKRLKHLKGGREGIDVCKGSLWLEATT
jgi:hypothetical protein